MMRVALVTSEFPSSTHPYIAEWSKQLYQQGLDLTIFTETTSDYVLYEDLFYDTDLRARVWKFPRVRLRHWPVALAGAALSSRALAAFRVLRQDPFYTMRRAGRKLYEYSSILNRTFDVVHFNAPQIAIRRFELGKLLGARTVVSFRGQDFTFYPDRYDGLLRDADHLHFISEHLVRAACKRGYNGDKHSLIYPMVDTRLFYPPAVRRPASTGEPIRVFTAARLMWTKGYEFALQAIALLVRAGIDIHYYIAGNGEDADIVSFTISELGLAERVHMLGLLSPAQVRAWMWNSDLYVLASVEEGFNNSVLQAQACGLPVVCADAGGLPENIVDGETGLLAKNRDAWDFAEKVRFLIEHPGLRTQMGQAGAQHAKKYDLMHGSSAFIQMYDEIKNKARS